MSWSLCRRPVPLGCQASAPFQHEPYGCLHSTTHTVTVSLANECEGLTILYPLFTSTLRSMVVTYRMMRIVMRKGGNGGEVEGGDQQAGGE
jgi:hypothetical protein